MILIFPSRIRSRGGEEGERTGCSAAESGIMVKHGEKGHHRLWQLTERKRLSFSLQRRRGEMKEKEEDGKTLKRFNGKQGWEKVKGGDGG